MSDLEVDRVESACQSGRGCHCRLGRCHCLFDSFSSLAILLFKFFLQTAFGCFILFLSPLPFCCLAVVNDMLCNALENRQTLHSTFCQGNEATTPHQKQPVCHIGAQHDIVRNAVLHCCVLDNQEAVLPNLHELGTAP
jgi:hypothetical protein